MGIFAVASLERFHNSYALSGFVRGGIFLRKMPLEGGGLGVQQLWNRCSTLPEKHMNVLLDSVCGIPGESSNPKIDLRTLFPVSRTKSTHGDLSLIRLEPFLSWAFR